MAKQLIVCVTGAAGHIAYCLYNTLCSTDVFGEDVEIVLRLIEVQEKIAHLKIMKMELEDCCYLRVLSIQVFSVKQQAEAFDQADVVIFLGSRPRNPGMDRQEVFEQNAEIFREHGMHLDQVAKKTCKSIVVSNPPNTNCLVLSTNAPSIPKENFSSLTRLDYNRFLNHVSEMFECNSKDVSNLAVWGNHSKGHFCDIYGVKIAGVPQEVIDSKIKNFDSRLIEKALHERGGHIADKMNSGAYLSAAKSIIDHLRDWFMGKNKRASMGVILPKQIYGLPAGMCFSMPIRCLGDGNFSIIQDLELNANQVQRLDQGKEELLKEREMIAQFLVPKSLEEPATEN